MYPNEDVDQALKKHVGGGNAMREAKSMKACS